MNRSESERDRILRKKPWLRNHGLGQRAIKRSIEEDKRFERRALQKEHKLRRTKD